MRLRRPSRRYILTGGSFAWKRDELPLPQRHPCAQAAALVHAAVDALGQGLRLRARYFHLDNGRRRAAFLHKLDCFHRREGAEGIAYALLGNVVGKISNHDAHVISPGSLSDWRCSRSVCAKDARASAPPWQAGLLSAAALTAGSAPSQLRRGSSRRSRAPAARAHLRTPKTLHPA